VQWLVDDRDEETKRRDRDDRENEEPSRKKQVVEQVGGRIQSSVDWSEDGRKTDGYQYLNLPLARDGAGPCCTVM
jgi:hypothetical protein